jgi:hypothetical protein
MAANVAVAQDPAGNLKPAKDKSTERIDGIVALIMAIGRALGCSGGAAALLPGARFLTCGMALGIWRIGVVNDNREAFGATRQAAAKRLDLRRCSASGFRRPRRKLES